MLNSFKPLGLILFLALALHCTSMHAQEKIADDKEPIRILVLSFNRMEFHTEFSNTEIAMHNQTASDSVYYFYQYTFLQTLTDYTSPHLQFALPTETEENYLRTYIRYTYQRKPTRCYIADLSLLDDKKLQHIMQQHSANYLLLVTWYKISKIVKQVPVGNRMQRKPFAEHHIDFCIAIAEKKLLYTQGNFIFASGKATAENSKYKFLRLKEVSPTFQALPNELEKVIESLSK